MAQRNKSTEVQSPTRADRGEMCVVDTARARRSGAATLVRVDGAEPLAQIQSLPLDAIQMDHLIRDRLTVDEEAMAALEASLEARGQQMPIEVTDLGGGAFGLISGWRRMTALRRLWEATGAARFSEVQAVVRAPASVAETYVAMVEENEVRAGLSYYERARIVARAVEDGAFADEPTALRAMFASVSRSQRSKINAFLTIYHGLDAALQFPTELRERLGQDLAKALKQQDGFADAVVARLEAEAPGDAEAERAVLAAALDEGADAAIEEIPFQGAPLIEIDWGDEDPDAVAPPPLPQVVTLPLGEGHDPVLVDLEKMENGLVLQSMHNLGFDLEMRRGLLELEPCIVLRGALVTEDLVTLLRRWIKQTVPSLEPAS